VRSYEIETPAGIARAHVVEASGRRAGRSRPVVLALGHGAGGGVQARDLSALAEDLPRRGVTTVLVEQPWRVAGGRVAAAPPRLDLAWTSVLAAPELAAVLHPRGGRLAAGGRSAGARVACRTAAATGADLVVCLAFPLHPPGRPERSRVDELVAAGAPTLVVQGERDPFGGPEAIAAAAAAVAPPTVPLTVPVTVPEVVAVPYADHGFAVPRSAPLTQAEALQILTEAVAGFLLRPATGP
jgi:predicted alpha/beta-hydrolase family hydrolase